MAQQSYDLRFFITTCGLVGLGALGGWAASWAGLPMPWMLGSLLATALAVTATGDTVLKSYAFPNHWRAIFVALIGVMIGSQVTPDLLRQTASLPLSFAAMVLFIPLAHSVNYAVFHRLGGYDKSTAFFAGVPGGLAETIIMGENAGADPRILTAQQFLRIILVITLLPIGLSIWTGAPVGSAAGLTGPAAAPVTPGNLVLIAVAAGLGLWGAKRLRFPAPPLSGPLFLAALATVTGALDLHLPFWLIAVAQLVIGVSLGLRFKGMDGALLRRCLWLSAVSVSVMMAIGASFAAGLWAVTGLEYLALMLSFAPGGVSEMSLVALSLGAGPALVSLHHILRIVLAVMMLGWAARWLGFENPK